MKKQYLPIAVAGVLLVVATVAEGIWSERWVSLPEDEMVGAFANRLKGVPTQIGEWTSTELEMDPLQQEIAGIRGYVSRTYTNRRGDQVTVQLVCGARRHISVHTPDQCYRAAGYEQERETDPYTVKAGSTSADFNWTVFKKEDEEKGLERLRIFWSWNYDGRWVAPKNARMSLVGQRALYKLYLISPESNARQSFSEAALIQFAQELIPAIDPVLFPPKPAGPGKQQAAKQRTALR